MCSVQVLSIKQRISTSLCCYEGQITTNKQETNRMRNHIANEYKNKDIMIANGEINVIIANDCNNNGKIHDSHGYHHDQPMESH